MTFLAPWALLVGALAAAGLVALHLVARQRPAAYPLPTARFVPDRRTLVSRVSQRPRDVLLLLLRVLLVLSAAAAFARPVLVPQRSARSRVLLLDRSAAVAEPAGAARRAREIVGDGVPTRVLLFDSAVVALAPGAAALDSLARTAKAATRAVGSLSAALAAARRLGAESGVGADSVELVLVSPVTAREVDASTDSIRALWPGQVRLVRVAASSDSSAPPALERDIPEADVLGPSLALRAVRPSERAASSATGITPSSLVAVRLLRGPPSAADSAFARSGGTVVRWDSIASRALVPSAIVMGDDVVVAALARDSLPANGVVLARWADGSAAAVERPLGSGCLREIAIGVPVAGDLPLRPAFQRIVNGLTDACAGTRDIAGPPLGAAHLAALAGPASVASGAELANGVERPTPLAPWLLGVALACALAELLLRRSFGEREGAS